VQASQSRIFPEPTYTSTQPPQNLVYNEYRNFNLGDNQLRTGIQGDVNFDGRNVDRGNMGPRDVNSRQTGRFDNGYSNFNLGDDQLSTGIPGASSFDAHNVDHDNMGPRNIDARQPSRSNDAPSSFGLANVEVNDGHMHPYNIDPRRMGPGSVGPLGTGMEYSVAPPSATQNAMPVPPAPQQQLPNPGNSRTTTNRRSAAASTTRGVARPPRRRAVNTAAPRYRPADEMLIESMMRQSPTMVQAEQVARLLPGNRSANAILTKWRRRNGGSYAHPHPGRRGGGGNGKGNGEA